MELRGGMLLGWLSGRGRSRSPLVRGQTARGATQGRLEDIELEVVAVVVRFPLPEVVVPVLLPEGWVGHVSGWRPVRRAGRLGVLRAHDRPEVVREIVVGIVPERVQVVLLGLRG